MVVVVVVVTTTARVMIVVMAVAVVMMGADVQMIVSGLGVVAHVQPVLEEALAWP